MSLPSRVNLYPRRNTRRPSQPPELTPADQKNMVFMGTLVTRGTGALITATGMDTEMGRIAHLIQSAPPVETPLQKRLSQLGRILILGCLVIVGVVFATGVWQGFPVYKMFMVGVTLAVAAIPEGLPAVVTIALAVGVQRMARRRRDCAPAARGGTPGLRDRHLFRQDRDPHPKQDDRPPSMGRRCCLPSRGR